MQLRGPAQGVLAVTGLLAAVAWALFRSGVNLHPSTEDITGAASIWPVRPDSWMTAFYSDSPLNLIVFRVLGLEAPIQMQRLSLIFALVAVAVLVWWQFRTVDSPFAMQAARLVVLSPIVAILLTSIGSYDAFTVLCWSLALWMWSRFSKWWMLLAGIPLGIQHFEHAALGAVALSLAWLALKATLPTALSHKNPVWLLPGIGIGKLLLILTFLVHGQAAFGRTGWIERYLTDWLKNGISTLPILVYALFAGLWILVLFVALQTGSRREKLLLLAAFTVGIIGLTFSADRPQVFVVIMLPSLIVGIMSFLRSPQTTVTERRVVEAAAWIAPPVVLGGRTAVNSDVLEFAVQTPIWMSGMGSPS